MLRVRKKRRAEDANQQTRASLAAWRITDGPESKTDFFLEDIEKSATCHKFSLPLCTGV